MKQHNLRDVLKALDSDKITERRDAITSLRQIFDKPAFVDNFHVTEDGHVNPCAWLSVYQALFNTVGREIIVVTKAGARKASGVSSVAERRLEDAAGTVRWLTERTVHLLSTRVTKSLFAHLLQTIVYRKEFLTPVALHYLKALRCLVGHIPHLEHLDDVDWIRIVEIAFNCLLGDPIGHRFQDDKHLPQDVDDSELWEEDESPDDNDLPTTPRTGKRTRPATPMTISNSSIGSKRSRSLIQVSVTHEQVESMSLISVLLGSSSSPILSSNYIYLPSSILTRLRRFLERYPCDTSLLHDYVVALASTLSQLTLNNTLEVTKFALASWDSLLGLWGTRNKRIKEGLVSIFRMLFPFVTSENEAFRLTAMAVDLADGLHTLSSVLDGEADNRRGVDGLSLECLRLETADDSHQQLDSAFIAKSFRYGWNFDGNQALAWAILELRADCIAKLFQLSESMQPPPTSGLSTGSSNQRLRREDHIVSLLTSIQDRSPSNVRSYHLQTLLFVIDRHWHVFHHELQNDIVNVLLAFVPLDDGMVQSWVFLCFAAIAAANSSSGVTEATWDLIWTNAIRRANVPTVSRASCHAAYVILLHTRNYTHKTHLVQIPLASNRILFEIETLAKELDVQGPPYPFDSVCAFLATCLRVANQDMHLYRMQLEEKVLSWLIDCWQTAEFRDKSLPLHLGKDLLMLFESISGFPTPINLPFRIPLPDGQIVEVLVNEAKTTVIMDYILEARLPQFQSVTDSSGSVDLPPAPPSDDNLNSLTQPRGRERRISAFLVKTLERMQTKLDDRSMHPTAELARRSLDMAVTAVSYDSVLVLNGMQSDRRLSRCACKLIGTVIALLPDPRWTTSERALISFGLDPLTFLGDSSGEKLAWIAMLPPDIGSGIKSQLLSQLSRRNTNENAFWKCSNVLRILWQNTDVQSMFSSVEDTMREVFRIALGANSKSPAHAMDVDDHFEPIRMATEQLSANKDDVTVDLISRCFIMDICISFLTVGPTLQSTSGEPTRDKQLIDDVLYCANTRPEAFLSVVPIIISKSQQRFLDLSLKGLDSLLVELSKLLPLYQYSRSDRLHSVTIQFLEATLEVWASANVAIGDTLDKFRQLCHWFSQKLKDRRLRSWGVRDLFARFIDRYLTQDPSEQIWNNTVEDLTPSCLLLALSQDDDMRVRFRVAVKTARLFAFARRTVPRRTTNDLYLVIKDKLTIDLNNREHMLTRILSLGNTMIVASETRRGAYWHLLETCLHTQDYSAHIETVLRAVSQRLGLIDYSSLFENYASQLAMSLLQVKKDFLLFPPHVLGYRDRKECVSANFRSFAPVNVWNGGRATFENHCKIASFSPEDALRDCFGNIIGYEIVSWIDRPDPDGNDLMRVLKTVSLPDEEFSRCLAQNIDTVVASVLRSLGDMDVISIVDALVQDDPSGHSAAVFNDLIRYRTDIMETHRPNLPAFPTETILRALHWLRSQAQTMDEKAVSYHIIHQLLADVDRSPFINEQFRLVNSICLWIATHSSDFIEITLLYTLMHGTTALLGQVDLSRSAQSILDWAFICYRKAKTKHPHVPDILVRIACIAYDLSRTTSDTTLMSLGTDLLQWIDLQTFELSKVPSLSGQVMKALPAWPHHPSPQLADLLQSITGEHLSSVLGDYRISSSKFRLVRRLRDHGIVGEFDRDHFAKVDFWRLKECIPPSDQLQDADLYAFATLLYLSKGQLGGFHNDPSGSTSILGRYRRKASKEKEGTKTSPQEPIILMLLSMLQGEHPSQSNTAYETLRLIMSAERDEPSHTLRLASSENQVELEYLGRYKRPQLSQVCRDLTDLVTQQSYLDSVINFPRWIADVTTLFSGVLSSKDAFYAQLAPILRSDTEFAEQILPILVHSILTADNEELVKRTITETCYRDTISKFFTSVLLEKSSSIQCLRCVIDVVLHLRHFDREQTSSIKGKVIKDALSYNNWLNIDFTILAHSSITCGAYTTALLFLELAAEGHAVSQDASNEILYEIYRHIDEPDGFYAIHDSDLHQNLIKRFHHEKQWERAFRFHGAALEAGKTTSDTEGLVQSFHSFGFDHLANDVLRTTFSNEDAKKDGPSHDISYRLAWRTETWDLPESSEKSTGASMYLALRAIHRERDVRAIDHTIRRCLFTEIDRLRTLGLEDFAEIRDVIQDVMCLHEVAKWRTNTIQTSLAARDLTKGNWSEFLKIEDDFDFPTLENFLATRISLVRSVRLKEERQRIGTLVTPFNQSLIDIETKCLVQLSKAARAANEVQLALNSIVRAVGLEKPPSFDVFEEFANVLWCQKEEKIAIEYLGRLFAAGQGTFVRDVVEERRKALVYAQLGSWSSAARLKNPQDIQTDYFSAAISLLKSDDLSSHPESHNDHATVYHQYAIFAERQYYDIVKSPDAIRWKIYVDRKQREIESLNMQIDRSDESDRQRLRHRRDQAQKMMNADVESVQRHNFALDGFLNQAIDMYSHCLGISDAYDQDVPIRLCSLWFAHFEEDRGNFQKVVENALRRVPSRKFVFLSHQLSARISKPLSGSLSNAQINLQSLVLRMCKEHPFHILYQVYCLQPEGPRNTGQTTIHAERAEAASYIFNKLRKDPTAQQRLMDVERLSEACLQWAKQPVGREKNFYLPREFKLSKITNLRVPVITHHTPVDPSMRYDDCPWIDHYETQWTNAGGKNTPKIGYCIGTDGVRYKQLFKGQGQDDLRQDAVMEQVFSLVNGILHRDRETRRRLLNVREYKVIPLAPQGGILEFVENTHAIRDWLVRAHQRYHPREAPSHRLSIEITNIRKDKDNARPLRDRLIQNWAKIEENIKPVMRHFFTEKHKTPNSWFATRLEYSRSVATSSIVGHILGLGDRHISNILIDNVTGQVIPIDLGIAFDQGKLLGVPELVPFRLTRDMVDGMGTAGTAGVFQRCAEETLRVLRDGSEVIMTVLEVFKHDPLHSWTASEMKIQRVQEGSTTTTTTTTAAAAAAAAVGVGVGIGIDMSSGSAEEAADRALSSVSRKLDKSLSVQTVVSQLIREATDSVNLALMFEGWSAFY